MRVSRLTFAVAATAALTAFPVAPTSAGFTASISAAPTTLKPGEQTTVTGTTDCNSVAYTITLTYTKPDDTSGTATVGGTTDASGEFSQAITLPENATAEEPASVSASVACGGGSQSTNTVNLTVEAHEGTLTVDPTSGEKGTTVTISGTNCYGGDVYVAFGDGEEFPYEAENVTVHEDKTFSGTFVIPNDAGPGQYAFAAACPGTDYNLAPFTVVAGTSTGNPPPSNPPAGPPQAPPAAPVVDTPRFTG